jgi:hypothetical protein
MIKRLLLALCAFVVMGLAMEMDLGGAQGASPGVAERVSDPSGHRLMVVILDSLSVEDAKQMKSLQRLEATGFSAEVEPCLERITYMCIKEALTGKSTFSLFGLFLNWGAAGDPGDNLLRDARSAGLKVAMVSAGDLTPFAGDLDHEERFEDAYTKDETRQALAYAKDHDLVVYHYIWHDTQAHHFPVGSDGYQRSLRDMDRVVSRLLKRLPDDMDVLVVGDHGHSADGRHVQGMDIPTVLFASSSRLKSGVVEDARIPISAVRYIAGVVTGLYSNQMEWAPSWLEWMAEPPSGRVGELLQTPPEGGEHGFPVTMVVWCGLLVALSSWIVGPGLTLLAMALGIGTGIGFDFWLQNMHFPGDRPRVFEVLWIAPLVAFLSVLGVKRDLWAAWRATFFSSIGVFLLLSPVLHHYGLLRNTTWVGLPLALVSALMLGHWSASAAKMASTPEERKRRWLEVGGTLLAAAIACWGWKIFTDFEVFNFEIVGYRQVGWMDRRPASALLLLAGLGVVLHLLIDRDSNMRRRLQWAMLAGVGVSSSISMASELYSAPFLMLCLGLFLRGIWRSRMISIGVFWCLPYLFPAERVLGILGVVSGTVVALAMLDRLRERAPSDWESFSHWGGGLTLIVGAYLSLAWSYGLSFSGIDYTFFMHWLPESGRWHERLWWLIFLAMVIKIFVPLILMVELCRSQMPDSLKLWAEHGARLGWLRCTGVLVFASAWVVHSGTGAAGIRMAGVVQDAFVWVLLSLMLAIVALVPHEREASSPSDAPEREGERSA